jgi:hypothetical protein
MQIAGAREVDGVQRSDLMVCALLVFSMVNICGFDLRSLSLIYGNLHGEPPFLASL